DAVRHHDVPARPGALGRLREHALQPARRV
ncbi:MAG: hypothetical protein AVDCRST_MAG01-01-1102, partial [uncultured Rubrobacteraceae bacterium]